MKTIFCDIDGTLLKHHGSLSLQLTSSPVLLEGSIKTLSEWDEKGYNIILTTGRRESCRDITEKQLQSMGIFYDQLIMGIGGGTRVLINDLKEDRSNDTAIAINVERNIGIKDVKL